MKRKIILFILLCLFISPALHAGTIEDIRERLNVKKKKAPNKISKKEILIKYNEKRDDNIKIVTCYDDDHVYAVCLPKNYGKEKRRYPVLFCFDPGGDGVDAVKKFMYAGEKYEWIVVGSLDAKNGPWAPILRAQKAVLKDVQKRFRVDDKNFYTAGFSGGARMAYTMAYNNPKHFKAVIACSAGFGLGAVKKKVAVCHCVGDEDCCNLKEVRNAYNRLKAGRVNTKLIEFSGDHRWPPTYVRNEAVDWIASI